jgi:hypothetical protein
MCLVLVETKSEKDWKAKAMEGKIIVVWMAAEIQDPFRSVLAGYDILFL